MFIILYTYYIYILYLSEYNSYQSAHHTPKFPHVFFLIICSCWSISCTENRALHKVPSLYQHGKREGQTKPGLSGGESHTARQGKVIALQAKSDQVVDHGQTGASSKTNRRSDL